MKSFIKLFFNKVIRGLEKLEGVLDTYNTNTYSMRKVLTSILIILVVYMDISYMKYASPEYKDFFYILGSHFLMILLLLGIVTAEHIIKYKEEKSEKKSKNILNS